jgi:hypothetical protein
MRPLKVTCLLANGYYKNINHSAIKLFQLHENKFVIGKREREGEKGVIWLTELFQAIFISAQGFEDCLDRLPRDLCVTSPMHTYAPYLHDVRGLLAIVGELARIQSIFYFPFFNIHAAHPCDLRCLSLFKAVRGF